MIQRVADRMNSTHRIAEILGLAVVVAGVWSFLGLPSWVVLVVAFLPWAVLVYLRAGGVLAITVFVFGEFLALLATLLLTAALRLPMLATIEVLWTVGGLAGAWLLARNRRISRRALPGPSTVAIGLPAMVGGVAWLGVLVATQFVPRAARISWVMLGDSANNILIMRDILRAGGLAIGPTSNPVPLPAALLTVIGASGRGQITPADYLRHDLSAMVLTWSILIALCTLAAGIVAGFLARSVGARPWVIAVAAGGASLLPLSWFFSGDAIDFGFLDAELAIPLVLFAFLAYLGERARPAISVGLLCVSATLLLAVWSPLVLVPALLTLAILVREWRRIIHTRGIPLVILVVGLAQLLAYGIAVTLPGFLSLGHLLTSLGAVYPFHNWMILLIAAAALVLGLLAYGRFTHPIQVGVTMVIIASALGVGFLLFGSRNQPSPWTYYPVKLAWICSAVLVVLIVGLAIAVVARRFRSILAQSVGMVVVAVVTVAFLAWAPTAAPGVTVISPAARLLKGEVIGSGDAVADRILHYTTPTHSVVLWNSGDPYESSINFWSWEMWADTLQGHVALRTVAYGYYDHKSVPELCRIIGLLGGGSTVYTEQPTLRAKLDATCPDQRANVVLKSAGSS